MPARAAASNARCRRRSDAAVMDTTRLAAMANQIASFFATQRGQSGALEVADHLRKFWEPRMRKDLISRVNSDGAEAAGLSPMAAAAIEELRRAPSAIALPEGAVGDGADRPPLGNGTVSDGDAPDGRAR